MADDFLTRTATLLANAQTFGKILDKLKPDGSPTLPFANKTSISKGIAKPAPAKESSSVNNIKDGKPESQSANDNGGDGFNLTSIVSNPLEQFASMTPLWTLAVLTPAQFNNPDSYRTEDLSFAAQTQELKTKNAVLGDDPDEKTTFTSKILKSGMIFSSAGRGDEYRTPTLYGTPEYYVDNFRMVSIIGANKRTGNSNAIEFTWDIYEPYSMGLLLQSMQVAALNAGYPGYLEAPYLLRLDLKGFDEAGLKIESIKPKFFVCKLIEVKFETNEAGSSYKCKAIPFNHQGFADSVDRAYSDIKIRPKLNGSGTVFEALSDPSNDQSLVSLLNKNEEALVNAGMYSIPDIYDIQFPEKSSDWEKNQEKENEKRATVSPSGNESKKTVAGDKVARTITTFGSNPIGNASFGFDATQGGNYEMSYESDSIDPNTGRILRDKLSIDPKTRLFQFQAEQKLTEIIVQMILSSSYAKAVLDEKNLTPEGYIKWFKIDVQMEFLSYDSLIGDFAKKYTYRVVPYLIHSSIFTNPSAVAPGYAELEKLITKSYSYIYTGQNVDVLKFDITINNQFYAGANIKPEKDTKDQVNKDNQGSAIGPDTKVSQKTGGSPEVQTAYLGKTKRKRDLSLLNSRKGGSGFQSVEKMVADNFNNVVINNTSADLISVNLEIIGDTYWLVDSGIANYFANPDATNSQITEDGTMNYEGSDVYVYLNFRTPADINESSGLYEFSNGQQRSPFSGIYRVIKCESTFVNGQFLQNLECIRMAKQATDFDKKVTSPKGQSLNAEITTADPTLAGPF